MPPEVLKVDKFDPSLGLLLDVEVVYKANLVGSVCVDNTHASCTSSNLLLGLFSTAVPSASNAPAVTEFSTVQLAGEVELTPVGFLLGAADGLDDCATEGVSFGPASTGDCTSGADHFAGSFDEVFSTQVGIFSGDDLSAWVGPPGTQVSFETIASGLQTGWAGLGLNSVVSAEARVWFEVTYIYSPSTTSVGTPFCFCTSAAPCANHGAGGEGCANSTGVGAILWASGSDSISAADLVLHGAQLPPGEPGLFFQAENAVGGGGGTIFGDGLRCAGGAVVRLGVAYSNAAGESASSGDIASLGAIVAGDLRRYQLWYRDSGSSPCGGHFNLTGGLELIWMP